ncbi:MAG: hypothetical protein LC620_08255, partial [Halobacteriales archaeon]|nr:hypothetical protein [Halobacteriales archaeon]
THYMDEAEQLCDELVVMDQGKVLERGAPRDLIAKHTQGEAVEFVVGWSESGEAAKALSDLLAKEGVPHERLPDRVVAYGAEVPRLAHEVPARAQVHEVLRRRATLEDVFLRLTGRALRD